jgi:hypothetical protein
MIGYSFDTAQYSILYPIGEILPNSATILITELGRGHQRSVFVEHVDVRRALQEVSLSLTTVIQREGIVISKHSFCALYD